MLFKILKSAIAAVGLTAIGNFSGTTVYAAYPERPITMVVPYAPGGFATMLAHLLGEKMSETLGQPIIIQNRPGANGNIASRQVVAAKPDGYTFLLGTSSVLAINPSLYDDTGFDPQKDFEPVAQLVTTANIAVVNARSDIRTISDLIAHARNTATPVTFGSSGTGSSMHLSGEMFNIQAGVSMTHVPYQGGAPALTDLIGGRITAMFSDTTAIPMVKDGRLRAIGVTGSKRMAAVPSVPTIAESGLPDFIVESWYGFMVPAGTSPAAIQRLSEAAAKAANHPEVLEKLREVAAAPASDSTPGHLRQILAQDLKRWAPIVAQSRQAQ